MILGVICPTAPASVTKETNMARFEGIVIGSWLFVFALWLAFWGTIAWVAWHFISKWW